MTDLSTSLPADLKGWVDQHVSKGRHSDADDFIRDVLRQAQRDEEDLAALQAEIQKGRDSGPGRDAFAVFAELKAKYGSSVDAGGDSAGGV